MTPSANGEAPARTTGARGPFPRAAQEGTSADFLRGRVAAHARPSLAASADLLSSVHAFGRVGLWPYYRQKSRVVKGGEGHVRGGQSHPSPAEPRYARLICGFGGAFAATEAGVGQRARQASRPRALLPKAAPRCRTPKPPVHGFRRHLPAPSPIPDACSLAAAKRRSHRVHGPGERLGISRDGKGYFRPRQGAHGVRPYRALRALAMTRGRMGERMGGFAGGRADGR